MPSERATGSGLLWSGLSGGLCGGSAAGMAEAIVVLSSIKPSEYQALLHGAVLYGAAGVGIGAVAGVALAIAGRFTALSRGVAWSLAFWATAGALGYGVAVHLLDMRVYEEQGVPPGARLALVGGLGLVALVGIWLGGNLLTKTPLRAVTTVEGTALGWGGTMLLAFLFSRAPAPGATGTIAPHRPQAASFSRKPDVYLLVVDALRADAVGALGAPATPSLDRLAEDAVVFEQHVAASSWTRTAMASLLTSRAPSAHGCERRTDALADEVTTLAEAMRANGYATGGLPNTSDVSGALGFDQGFDWYPFRPDHPLGAEESSAALSLFPVARDLLGLPRGGESVPAETQLARARAFVDANAAERFLLFVHLAEPAAALEPGDDDARRGRYAGAVGHVDAELGRFLDALRAEGRYDDALIIVTADHGEELGDHGGWGHGTALYDEQLRVPLIVKLPGNARAGTRVPWQVRQIDVAPTVAEVAGFPPDPSWQGLTLFDDAFDDDLARMRVPEEWSPEDPPFVPPTWAEHPAGREALSELEIGGIELRSLRGAGHKIIQAVRAPRGMRFPPQVCFDVLEDPREARDLAVDGACDGAMAARLERLVLELEAEREAEAAAARALQVRARRAGDGEGP